jgi:molybdate transport system substrate-binding protein
LKITYIVSMSLLASLTVYAAAPGAMNGAQAAEVRVLAGGAMAGVWADIKLNFEQSSGHKLQIFYGTTPNLIKEVTSGKPFDVGIVPRGYAGLVSPS